MTIKFSNITKMFDGRILYSDATFSIKSHEKIGLIGQNGVGKTTLMNIIYGIEAVQKGKVTISSDTRIGYLNQMDIYSTQCVREILTSNFSYMKDIESNLHSIEKRMQNVADEELTSLLSEYQRMLDLFDSYGGYNYEVAYSEFISLFGMNEFINRNYSELSGGQKQYVRLCLCLFGDYNILLLDEPTSFLDDKKRHWLEVFIKQSSKTFLIVSHDNSFISNICNGYLDIDNCEIKLYKGTYEEYANQKNDYIALQKQRNTTATNKILLLQESLKNQYEWMGKALDKHKHKVVIDRLKREINKQEYKIKKEKSYDFSFALNDKNEFPKTNENILLVELKNICFSYGEKAIISNFSLSIHRQSRILVLGENGVGKTTLLNIIAGKSTPTAGEFFVKKKISTAYVEQSLFCDNLNLVEYYMRVTQLSEYDSKEHIDDLFGIEKNYGKLSCSHLSGGERKRLQIAAYIATQPDLLLLDEPTVSLDEYTVGKLFEMLSKFDGAILIVSHDERLKKMKAFKHIRLI